MSQLIFYVWNKAEVNYFIAHRIVQVFMGSNSICETKSLEKYRDENFQVYMSTSAGKFVDNWASAYNTKYEW